MVLRDLINTSRKHNQNIIIRSKTCKDVDNSNYLCETKAFSKLIDFVGDLEVIYWEVEGSYLVVYLLLPEDGGVEDAE